MLVSLRYNTLHGVTGTSRYFLPTRHLQLVYVLVFNNVPRLRGHWRKHHNASP